MNRLVDQFGNKGRPEPLPPSSMGKPIGPSSTPMQETILEIVCFLVIVGLGFVFGYITACTWAVRP